MRLRSRTMTAWVRSTAKQAQLRQVRPRLQLLEDRIAPAFSNGLELRTFRIAIASTAEFTVLNGGPAGTETTIKAAVDELNLVYGKELSINFVLVPNNNSLIFTNTNTDNFTSGDKSALIGQSQTNITNIIGSANFDIGHTFDSGYDGGLASEGVGNGPVKGRGTSGRSVTIINAKGEFDSDFRHFIAHEVGHQFSAGHTFNAQGGPGLAGEYDASSAYEPGLGITLMSYALYDVDNNYATGFSQTMHIHTLDQITTYIDNVIPSVGTKQATGNAIPSVTIDGAGWTIPANTPFVLTGTGSDPGDTLTYTWEERDLGPAQSLGQPDNGKSPLFRTFEPSANGNIRSFPALETVLAGQTGSKTEVAATTARNLNFRLTARDAKGAYNSDGVIITTVPSPGFTITNFNLFQQVFPGTKQTITWNVAGTNASPINVTSVAIDFSKDGGKTFTTLSANESNDGSAEITLPSNSATEAARFRIRANGNIFYDINNANFKIKAFPTTLLVQSDGDGLGSLRLAIEDSNSFPGLQTIEFSPTYFSTPRTIVLTGELAITDSVTIEGPGADFVTISGNNASRIFNTAGASAGTAITLEGLTLTAGHGADGGAIYSEDETLFIDRCDISNNSASGDGGAINMQLAGRLILKRSTISGNTAGDDGGGIYFNQNGSAFLNESTLSDNKALNGTGGGLYFFGVVSASGLSIVNCTITGNSAATGGGGILLNSFTGTLDVRRSTITGNNTVSSLGGGIARSSGSGTIAIQGSIVSGNTASFFPDVFSDGTVNMDYSAIGSTSGFTLTGAKNLIGQNLKLRPLASNGGPTQTVAFEYDSPLHDAGEITSGYSFDQRGIFRSLGDVTDIGAFELHTYVNDTDDVTGNDSLREAIVESNRVAGPDTITFGSKFSTSQVIILFFGELAITEALTIVGPGASLVQISGNNNSRVFNTAKVPAGDKVTLRNLTLTAGSANEGGAIYSEDEHLTIEDSVISNSSATVDGGAINIEFAGTLTLVHSTLSGNTAADDGGAIYFRASGSAKIDGSTIANNKASNGIGGGLYFFGAVGSGGLTVINSTIAGNSAALGGGGIVLPSFSGTLNVINSTITANDVTASSGGGIVRTGGTGAISIESSIVSGNGSFIPDVFSSGTVNVNNSAIGSTAGFTLTGSNNLIGEDLKLGALANNGGPTLTILPAVDSPVINKGSNTAMLATDQRGISRTLLGGTDIGSVELTSVPDTTAPTILSITSNTPNGNYTAGAAISVAVTFSEPVTLSGTLNVLLDTGGIVYVYGPFTGTTLMGTYTVLDGQASSDLNVTALTLPGGSKLRDAALNNAVLTLPSSNLANNSAIVITNTAGGNGTVTNLLDSGPGSLRAAIDKANATPGANTILFDPNLTGTITLASQLDITDAVSILGPAAAPVNISGNNTVRVFNTISAPANTVINFTRLTIANGKAGFGAGLQMGDEAVLLDRCILMSNTASVNGGAIYVGGGSLTLQNSTVTNNQAAGSFGGGGIYSSDGAITILSSTISKNTVTGSGNAGGGLFLRGTSGAGAVIRNSTFSGNSAPIGGGIAGDYGFSKSISVENSTITGNSANSGGGIDQNGYFANLQLSSSIVFGNTAATGSDLRSNAVINATTSLVGSKAGANNFVGDAFTNSKIGINPLLGPLTNNGGPTLTHGFAAGSAALDNGVNPFSEPYDQRGIGFPRVIGGKADIGAVEGAVSVPSLIVTNDNDSGAGSLRQAILNANNQPGTDTVTFDAAFFATPRTIALTSAEIAITEALTITGPGSLLATVSGGNVRRIFNASKAPSGAVIALSGLTLTGGNAGVGGAIYAEDESIVIAQSTITGNAALSGGGIAVTYGGTLNLSQSTVSGNTASIYGGGIYLNYSATNGASADVVSSTLVGNKANQSGGGIFVLGNAGPDGLRFLNSTISGNSATGKGGGVALFRLDNSFQVLNSTITNNSSGTGAFGGGGGGGMSLAEGNGAITIDSSIVSGNFSAEAGIDINSAKLVNVNFSAIGWNSGFTLTGANNLPFGANLQLGALANNGGSTLTHAITALSPAINKGSNTTALGSDQRGSGFVRSSGGATDIGAYEFYFSPLFVFNANDSGPYSLREAIAFANSNPGADTITFDPTFFSTPRTITLGGGQMVLTDTAGPTTIAGPGVNALTIDVNSLTRAFLVNASTTATISGMTIANGNSGAGGALQNHGTVTVSNSRFTNNKSDLGGAIHNVGLLSVANSTFDNNAANTGNGWGGAIINGTTVGVTNIIGCTFTNNLASSLGGAVIGFSFNISDSTFTNNTAGLNGGAIRTDGTVVITGSTFSGNSAANDGGAIMSHGTTTISNSTVANNSAKDGGGIFFFEGVGSMHNVTLAYNSAGTIAGGAHVGTAANVTAVNTIIAGNAAPSGSNVGGAAFNASSSNNVFDLSAAAAGLGTLANNGGATQTIALLPGSPAINAGTSFGAPTTDQRGLLRVGNADIGAFEAQIMQPAKVNQVTINGGTAQRSSVTTMTVMFDHPVTFATTPAAVFQLQRQSDGSLPNLSATVNSTRDVVTLTFLAGAAVEFGSLADGRYTLTILAGGLASDGFDGDDNGIGGDDYLLTGTPANGLFRLFGDADGNGTVTAADFNAFRLEYGTNSPSIFDFDGNYSVSASDFNQFRTRYGVTIVP